MFYIGIIWIEFSPALLERFRLHAIKRVLEKYMFVFIAIGMLLPTMHQSSLGTVLLVNEGKLSPLWWTEWLPLLYLASAVAMGYGVVVFESTLVSRGFRLKSELPLLSSILRPAFWLTVLFLVVRLWCHPDERQYRPCFCRRTSRLSCSGSRPPLGVAALILMWFQSRTVQRDRRVHGRQRAVADGDALPHRFVSARLSRHARLDLFPVILRGP